jgi:methionyl-tRNA formyltransferase
VRILFAGTPDIAIPALEAIEATPRSLEGRPIELVAVLTSPDTPIGRKKEPQPSPVKRWASARGLPVIQPSRLDGAAREQAGGYRPDLLVVVAFGRIFGPRFLDLFPEGGINLHPSLLPAYRGPSPIQAAILAGDTETGVTVQRLALEMDAGEILAQQAIPIPPGATSEDLHRELGALGGTLLARTVAEIADGTARGTPQDESRVSRCHLIRKSDGILSWKESAATIERMIRAYTPWPGVRCLWNGTPLHLTGATVAPSGESADPFHDATPPGTVLGVDNKRGILIQTVDGVLAVDRLKVQARKEMDFRSFLNGNPSIISSVLEQA